MEFEWIPISNGSVRSIECSSDVTRRNQHTVNLVDKHGAPLRRVDNSDILTKVDIRMFKYETGASEIARASREGEGKQPCPNAAVA